jgi:hypothetical protein
MKIASAIVKKRDPYCEELVENDEIGRRTNLHRCKRAKWVVRWHAHGRIDGRRRGRTIRGTGWSRVVLTASPAKSNARVSDWVALHLIDGHFGSMTLDELNKATAFARRNLDIGNLSKPLEERTKLIFRHIARKAPNKNCRVVRVGKLVHRLW